MRDARETDSCKTYIYITYCYCTAGVILVLVDTFLLREWTTEDSRRVIMCL